MPATPVGAAGSGVIDANGLASISVRGFTPGTVGAWSVIVTTPKGVATVMQGGLPVTAPTPIVNGGLGIGPLYLNAGPPVTVTITGGIAGSPVVVTTNGMESTNPDDVTGIGGMAASTYGAVQDNPANLLVGQVGPPLVENLAIGVPGTGLHGISIGVFDVSGYGALLLYGDPPPASQSLWLWVGWLDSTGNAIGYSQLDALNPKFVAVIGCEAAACEIVLMNTDAAQHNMSGLTIIPLAQIPVHPELLIPTAGGAFPVGINPTTPPNLQIISQSQSTPVGPTTYTGLFVWPGRALLSIGSSAGHTVTDWDASLFCTDANGVATLLGRFGQGLSNIATIPVQLTSGLASVVYHNDGAATTTTWVQLIATS